MNGLGIAALATAVLAAPVVRWVIAWRHQWKHAAHIIRETEQEAAGQDFYGSMNFVDELAAGLHQRYWLEWDEPALASLHEDLGGWPTVSGPEGAMGVDAPPAQPGCPGQSWLDGQLADLFAWVQDQHRKALT